MKVLYLLQILFLIGCQYSDKKIDNKSFRLTDNPSFKWQTDLIFDEKKQTITSGKAWLFINDQKFLISNDPFAKYIAVKKSEYKRWKIPSDSLTASRAWFAGHGETFYVKNDLAKKQLLVYSQQYSDVDNGIGFKVIKKIDYK